MGKNKNIVTILCDYGTKYESKIFNRKFLSEKNYLFRHGYEKNIISAKDLKKILNKKDLTVLDSRWFLKRLEARSLKNHIYQMQFF